MGLSSVIDSAVNSAFNAVGDLKVNITYNRITKSTHNANTLYVNDESESIALEVIRSKYKKTQIDNNGIKPNDLKLLVNASGLVLADGSTFHPTTQDNITYESRTFEIKDVDTIPSKAMFILQVRANEL